MSVSIEYVGSVIVEVSPTTTKVYRHDYEVLDYDGEGSQFVGEGVGWDYFLDYVDFPDSGRYLVTFTATYYPAQDIYEDADEDYEIGSVALTELEVLGEEEVCRA